MVGIIANPASGKDIRRLVAHGSVFDNQEKVRIVRRVLLGLAAAGVDSICYMPDYFGTVPRALDRLKIQEMVFPVPLRVTGTQEDSSRSAKIMEQQGARCIVTIGGDGTNRAVSKGAGSVPILPISTGTNNVFPMMVEGTIAGLAAGLVAQGRVPLHEGAITSTKLEVILDGEVVDLALVDIAVYADLFVGSRAVWEMDKIRQIFLNRAEPHSIGLSSIGGLIHPFTASQPIGLCLDVGETGQVVTAPVAPGVIRRLSIHGMDIMEPDQAVTVGQIPSVLALDGEREIELGPGQQASICLRREGPIVVDVIRTMAAAVKRCLFTMEEPKTEMYKT